eukprot:gnl/Trimastix_PCT/4012.p1 GENE.gnl/Trimastix_PCT/4012~~gnl/Trimastix_PCT/4012.p1  ORF type:complete len:951 (+),score=275.24 gnl/Trimastix_PCT/4012:40-2853(+)
MEPGSILDPLEAAFPKEVSLKGFFEPETVAVVGASERPGVGRSLLSNLVSDSRVLPGSFEPARKLTIYPINPRRDRICDIQAYPSLRACPTVPDLVVIVTPAKAAPAIVQECADLKIKSVTIISSGFKEVGAEGAALEARISEILKQPGCQTRVIGPNCFGTMCTRGNPPLNATFGSQMSLKGNVGLISQSGAMCTSILDWAFTAEVGFSYFASLGSGLDVDWYDMIMLYGQDEATKVIVLYMESIGNASRFMAAAQQVSCSKPIIVLKAGRTEEAAAAALSHTGSLTGADECADALFRRAGVVRVDTISDVFGLAKLLSCQNVPRGPRLMIVTNAGGPGVIATDSLIQNGAELAPVSEQLMSQLDTVLPPFWSHNNPIDILGSATPADYAQVLDIVLRDENTDGILVIAGGPVSTLSHNALSQQLKAAAGRCNKPLLSSFVGGEELEPARKMLLRAGIPCYSFSDEAARMYAYMASYYRNLQILYGKPLKTPFVDPAIPKRACAWLEEIRNEGRTLLSEHESKRLLSMFGIPIAETLVCATAEEAVTAAASLGYPVVLKLHSNTITHKSDVGGVLLNIGSEQAVREGYESIRANIQKATGSLAGFEGVTVQPMIDAQSWELLLGINVDAQFGPMIVFGLGGILVEIMKDKAIELPPLTPDLARRMIAQTKISKALQGARGRPPVPMDKLVDILVRFSDLVCSVPFLKELDINPLFAMGERIIAVDARVVLFDKATQQSEIPPLVVRPYPTQYISHAQTKDGRPLLIRPLHTADLETAIQFHNALSEESVCGYFHQNVPLATRVERSRLARLVSPLYDTAIPLSVFLEDEQETGDLGSPKQIGVGRVVISKTEPRAKVLLVIRDGYTGMGVGQLLLEKLFMIAETEGAQSATISLLHGADPSAPGMLSSAKLEALCTRMGMTRIELPGKILMTKTFA